MGRRRKSDNPFDLPSFTLEINRMKGKMGEDNYEMSQRLRGSDIRKIKKGGDFVQQDRDLFGRKVGKPFVTEVKTGPKAKLSKAQKTMKKRLGRRYNIVKM